MRLRKNFFILLLVIALAATINQYRTPTEPPAEIADSSLPEHLSDLAQVYTYCSHKYYDDNEEYYEKLHPESAERLFLRGLAFHSRLRLVEAEKSLEQALQQAPEDTSILFHLAEVKGQLGKFREGLGVIESLLAEDPYFYMAYGNRSWLEQELGLLEESETSWNIYTSVAPREY